MDPKKAAAEWFRTTVFKEEALRPRARAPQGAERLPPVLRAARSLENGIYQSWQSRETVFMKQGRLLAEYEDDYDFSADAVHYYPTYQALTDRELRGYFSWRTKLRKGDVRKTSLSFAFLYIYELLNQIGVTDPMDGYRRLVAFRDAYGQMDTSILLYLERWLVDYVVYYGLDPALLPDTFRAQDQCIAALERIGERDDAEIARALRQYSGWLGRSKFYAACQEDMDRVIVGVMRRMSARCAGHKKTMVDQYFGGYSEEYVTLFGSAVFCDPLKRKNYTYSLSEQCTYQCRDRMWTVRRRVPSSGSRGKLDDLLKAIDAAMRTAYAYGRPLKTKLETKWVLRTIQEEVQKLLAEKQANQEKKIAIDYAQLTQIRRDAAVTREKLIVEEEAEIPEEEPALQEEEKPVPAGGSSGDTSTAAGESPLDPAEHRLLHCLLYGGGLDWVQAEGHLLSVLVDGINEKLYDTFQDSVLDDTPCLFEDYIDDLKEMIHP